MEYIAPLDATTGKPIIIAQVSTKIASRVYIKIQSILFINISLDWVKNHAKDNMDMFIQSIENDYYTPNDLLDKKDLIALVFTRIE
jgi:hypothetical protein